MKQVSAIFDDGIKLYTSGTLSEEQAGRYNPCHYEVWVPPTEKFTGNLLKDNLFTLDVDKDIKRKLIDKFTITKDDTVLEIGAYNGWGTVRLSTLAKEVIAIEADGDNFKLLKKNLDVNNIKNVSAHHCAVGTDYGHAIFYKSDHPQGKSFKSQSLRNVIGHEIIQIIPVDGFIERATYVTMEINMGELDALYGMEKLLLNNNIRLIAAGWYKLDRKPTCYEMKKFLEKIGYKVFIGKINRVYAFNNKNNG